MKTIAVFAAALAVALSARAETVTLVWSAPTLNTDGSTLTDLASFRVSYCTVNPWVAQCPVVGDVAARNANPGADPAGLEYRYAITHSVAAGTTLHLYVQAIDTKGNPSGWASTSYVTGAPIIDVTPPTAPTFPPTRILQQIGGRWYQYQGDPAGWVPVVEP